MVKYKSFIVFGFCALANTKTGTYMQLCYATCQHNILNISYLLSRNMITYHLLKTKTENGKTFGRLKK
jgi:hypothetical protein